MTERPVRCAWLAFCLWLPLLAQAAPPLWEFRGAGGSVHVYGSMHLLPPGEFRLQGALAEAYDAATAIYLEVDLARLSPAEAAAVTTARAIDPQGRGLVELLGPEAAAEVRAAAGAAGLELGLFAPFEPWFAGLSIAALALQQQGYSAEGGVEGVLRRHADADGKPIHGLETLDEQLALLDALPAGRQAELLLQALQEASKTREELRELLEAWRSGDQAALEAQLARDFADAPELAEPLLHARNRRWADEVERLLREGGDALVVVGALHLVGPQGLIALLERRGYAPTRH